ATLPIRLAHCISFSSSDSAPPEISTLSLHDALPICRNEPDRDRADRSKSWRRHGSQRHRARPKLFRIHARNHAGAGQESRRDDRSEEHTSELQSLAYLVCRLLLEKKNYKNSHIN